MLQRLRNAPETAQTPVVICSIFNDPRLAFSLGATALVTKPVQPRKTFGSAEKSEYYSASASMDSLDFYAPTPPDITDHLADFRVEIVRRAALAVMFVAGAAAWMLMSLDPFPVGGFVILLIFNWLLGSDPASR